MKSVREHLKSNYTGLRNGFNVDGVPTVIFTGCAFADLIITHVSKSKQTGIQRECTQTNQEKADLPPEMHIYFTVGN